MVNVFAGSMFGGAMCVVMLAVIRMVFVRPINSPEREMRHWRLPF